jgi:hypothetical protein
MEGMKLKRWDWFQLKPVKLAPNKIGVSILLPDRDTPVSELTSNLDK